jgi:beta-glucanase (GH16 family)
MALFGSIPQTSKIESEEAALKKDHKEFKEYSKSEELQRFEELDKVVNTGEFTQKVKEIKAQKFKNTEEFKKEQELKTLQKSKDIKGYFKVKESRELENYKQTDKSDDLKTYQELAEYVNSKDFAEVKAGKEFKGSEAQNKEKEFNRLKGALKSYFKFRKSPKLENYNTVKDSDRLKRLKELEQEVQTDDFAKVKDYMALKPQQKYEQSKEYKLEEEYKALKDSEKMKWFQKLKAKNEFDKLKEWKLTFEDDFAGSSLDTGKWMTNYFWGEVLLKDTYALPGDKHFYTKGRNIEVSDSVMSIVTKQETASGKVWDPVLGFKPQEFNYTSGLISTANSFRQKYGKIRVKAKLSNVPVRQAIWMVAEKILPHVDIAKLEKSKLNYGNFWGNIAEKGGVQKKLSKKGGGKFSSDYFIYSLEWTPEKLVWKINDHPVLTQTQGVPQEPMYLVLSAGVTNGVSDHQLPSKMEVDWVKIYKKAEQE